jgi:predicted secreted protein
MRAARVVHDLSRVVVTIEEPKGLKGECVLLNIDGIASERREAISSSGACVFSALAAGTWQVKVAGATRWRVAIEE